MSHPKKPKLVQPILSILSSRWNEFWPSILEELKTVFGEAEFISEEIEFKETHYYDEELGTPIKRRILSFSKLISPEELVELKLFTYQLEQKYLRDNKRLFNLDPGILSYERLVLATFKEFTHRIYLRDGVWADLTLIFKNKKWVSLPWTYPDYKGETIQKILYEIRKRYKKKMADKYELVQG